MPTLPCRCDELGQLCDPKHYCIKCNAWCCDSILLATATELAKHDKKLIRWEHMIDLSTSSRCPGPVKWGGESI